MKELRDIKLDLLMGNQNPIIELFQEITSGIQIINCNVYNKEGLEFIYHKDGQWIFYQDSKNEKFWTHYYKFWELFESNFHLKYDEIGSITKYLIEEELKREVSKPLLILQQPNSYSTFEVEEALKREVSTPLSLKCIYINGVDAYLTSLAADIEEALKREVDTPALGYEDITK
jgi:hypothetical protein